MIIRLIFHQWPKREKALFRSFMFFLFLKSRVGWIRNRGNFEEACQSRYIKIWEIEYQDKKVTMNVLLLERGSGDWIRNGCTKYSIVAHWVVNPWMIFFVPAGLCKLFTLNLTTMLLQNAALYFYHRQGRGYLWQFLGPLQPLEFESDCSYVILHHDTGWGFAWIVKPQP